MIYKVELIRFGEGRIKEVEVPDNREQDLDSIFMNGQNEFASRGTHLPSVSVGDIIHFNGEKFIILTNGFEKMTDGFYNEIISTRMKANLTGTKYSELMWEKMGKKSFKYC